MLITDKNYLIVTTFIEKSDALEDSQALWQLGDQLEDMSCLFKIARVFSCFLKYICLEGWYLDQVRETYNAFTVCFIQTSKVDVETNPSLKAKVETLLRGDISQAVLAHVKEVIDLQKRVKTMAKEFTDRGDPEIAVNEAIEELCKQDIGLIDFFPLEKLITTKEIERVKGVLISDGYMPEVAEMAAENMKTIVLFPAQIERTMRESLPGIRKMMGENQSIWLRAIHGFPLEYTDRFPQFDRIFSGLQKGTVDDVNALSTAYHDCVIAEILTEVHENPEMMQKAAKRWKPELPGTFVTRAAISTELMADYQQIVDSIKINKANWLEMIKDLPKEYQVIFSKYADFARFFSGLAEPNDYHINLVVWHYHARVTNDISKEGERDVMKDAVTAEAILQWKKKAPKNIFVNKETIRKEIGEISKEITDHSPQLKAQFLEKFADKSESFKKFFNKVHGSDLIAPFFLGVRAPTNEDIRSIEQWINVVPTDWIEKNC